ncbi:hypothetical protein [Rhizobium arsenicireducens]
MNTAIEFVEHWITDLNDKLPDFKELVQILKSLPDDEAKVLLEVITATCDGDRGYGSVANAVHYDQIQLKRIL